MLMNNLEHSGLCGRRLGIDEIHNCSLVLTNYGRVRCDDEISHRGRVPVVPSCHSTSVIQSLLHNSPLAIRGNNETVKVNLKPVSDCIVVDSRSEATGANKIFTIKTATLCNCSQFRRRVPRKFPTPTTDV